VNTIDPGTSDVRALAVRREAPFPQPVNPARRVAKIKANGRKIDNRFTMNLQG
jgi:hypothetical protein